MRHFNVYCHFGMISYINDSKELNTTNQQQNNKNENLEKQNEMLLKRLEALENK